ncbi:MAG: prolyl oligopeptidase family serine peptidase [Rhodopila sp.]
MKQTAPFGTWVSPVTVDLVCGQSVSLSELSADGNDLFWLEQRPGDKGRTTLVRRSGDGSIQDVSPPGEDVGSRVHEYGGGSYVAEGGRILWSSRRDGSVWLLDPRRSPVPVRIAAVPGCRFADFRFVGSQPVAVCVREDHRDRREGDPEAAIVALDLAPGVNAAANEGSLLVRGADFYAYPRLSPDGQWLAWISWNHPDMPWDATQLHVAAFGGNGGLGSAMTVAGGPDEAVLQPAWSPNGILHFISDRTGWWSVYRAEALSGSGSSPSVTLAAAGEGEIGGPLWNLGARWYGFAPDGEIVAILETGGQARIVRAQASARVTEVSGAPQAFQCPVFLPASQTGVFRMAFISASPDSMPAVEITSVDRDRVLRTETVRAAGPNVLGPQDISVGTLFSFPTADGQTTHAVWYPPTNASFAAPEGERPPLVVMIHGGPTGSASNAFSLNVQWWTSRGFGVAHVNYRGSTGFGRAYRRALDGAWGVADVEDCIAAARYLAERGMVDSDRMAIRGGSAGGFTTLAALVSSDMFRAGASLYGIGDLSLLARDTHKFEARYLDRLVGPWPQAADVYAARSPINHMAAMTAPVIFFQGLEDKVVPPSQARVMVEAMTARGLRVAHYEFAGEGHGFRGAEALRRTRELELDFYGRVFGFEPPDLSERVSFVNAPQPPKH